MWKNLEMMANVFFINMKKNNKTVCQKSFSVFRDLLWAPQNTLKLVMAKNFVISFHAYEKYIFTKICWFGQNMSFQSEIHFKLNVTKDFFLM